MECGEDQNGMRGGWGFKHWLIAFISVINQNLIRGVYDNYL